MNKTYRKFFAGIICLVICIVFSAEISFGAGLAKKNNDVGEALKVKFIPGSYKKIRASREINLIVIHATGGPSEDPEWHFKGNTLEWTVDHFTKRRRLTSTHYVVGRDGRIVQLVKDRHIAWHAKGFNNNSIGIEVVNNGDGIDKFQEDQIISLIKLCLKLKQTYNLDIKDYKGHSDVDKLKFSHIKTKACDGKTYARKVDPGAKFPWERLRKALSDN